MTLFELLRDSGADVRVYDVGRRVGRIGDDAWLDFERAESRYAMPLRRKAWVALVQCPREQTTDPVIWFVKLSLDEHGLLVQAERDGLLARLAASAGADGESALRDNPQAFTPNPQRMALFHARLSADLGRPPSRHYDHAMAYFRGEPGWRQWEFVGLQGIADVACRNSDELLVPALPALPAEPLTALCHCLDSQTISTRLAAALHIRLERGVAAGDAPDVIAALVRALASSAKAPATRHQLGLLLDSPYGQDVDVLAALSGRAWEALEDDALLRRFLDRLAANRLGQAAFEAVLDDLLSLPSLDSQVRQALRDPGLPEAVRDAFGRMLGR